MGSITTDMGVTHNYRAAADKLYALSPRLTNTWREATETALRLLEAKAERAIASMAGGVYWKVESSFARNPTGARARVWTDKSRPHRIEPKKGQFLRFVVNGREVFSRGVNHPGSRPVDWLSRVASSTPDLIERNYSGAIGSPSGALGRL